MHRQGARFVPEAGELTAHQLTAAEANSLSELLHFFDGKSVNEPGTGSVQESRGEDSGLSE